MQKLRSNLHTKEGIEGKRMGDLSRCGAATQEWLPQANVAVSTRDHLRKINDDLALNVMHGPSHQFVVLKRIEDLFCSLPS